ncbi:MAG TPA: multicopper oxidase domain-containing protein, partial [Acidimicrobiales bacterium]|nr:multicopper oxidase domain-containing protein [Acidimicrobiales bacterium]
GSSDEGGASTSALATLTEFAINPEALVVSGSGTLDVRNDGSQVHNLVVVDEDVRTADLNGGESESLDISALDEGEYEVICDIAGHADAGMRGTMTVGDVPAGEAASGGDHGGGHGAEMTQEEADALDQAMIDSMMAFPAETEGSGNEPLEPVEIMEDGTKRFELTAEIIEWEVSPGEFVEAWAYNGMVPGPYIKVDLGDNLRFDVTNELPLGTDVHWHGVRTPNSMDGVAPYTQDVIKNGETFTYEFEAVKKAVGIYHAHIHGQVAVPNGMLGIIQIGDVDLPRGRTISGVEIPADLEIAQEIPMVLNDAGSIGLSLNGKSFPATEPIVTNNGDWVLVHYANEGLQVHPMHQHQFSQLVVAKDGIALDNPYFADTVNVAPGERYSVLINTDDPGTWVFHCHILTHVEREEGMFGMVTAMVVN